MSQYALMGQGSSSPILPFFSLWNKQWKVTSKPRSWTVSYIADTTSGVTGRQLNSFCMHRSMTWKMSWVKRTKMPTSDGPLLLKEGNYLDKDRASNRLLTSSLCSVQKHRHIAPECKYMLKTQKEGRDIAKWDTQELKSSLLAWKSATKHCGKIQTRMWWKFASKSWHHLQSLQNSGFSQLNDTLKLITGFQMTVNSCQACPVCEVICICVSCWFLKPGCTISVNAYSMEKHLTAQYLTSRTCFREIGKQAMTSTNPRLSFSPYYSYDVFLQHQEPHSSLRCPWARESSLCFPAAALS